MSTTVSDDEIMDLYKEAIMSGDLQQVIAVYDKIKISNDERMDLLEPVINSNCDNIYDCPFSIAVEYGFDDTCQWMFANFRTNIIQNINNNIEYICELGRLDILTWIDNNESESYDSNVAFVSALKNEKLEILDYLYDLHGSSIITATKEEVLTEIEEFSRTAIKYYLTKLIENGLDSEEIADNITGMIRKENDGHHSKCTNHDDCECDGTIYRDRTGHYNNCTNHDDCECDE